MRYERQIPSKVLEHLVECYWLINSEKEHNISIQKIIPDGYPETIFHYESAYEININGEWQLQPRFLLAGQLKNHFYLRNTGKSGMIGIKWKPTALSFLFSLDMATITDKVIDLPVSMTDLFNPLTYENGSTDLTNPLAVLDDYLTSKFENNHYDNLSSKAVSIIIDRKGLVKVNELTKLLECNERQLERHFKSMVGLSPKFFSRIIRLGKIFELMGEGNQDWADLVYHSGFYDQPHFIKNFKEFTGEDPSAYGFEKSNMANFHFKK